MMESLQEPDPDPAPQIAVALLAAPLLVVLRQLKHLSALGLVLALLLEELVPRLDLPEEQRDQNRLQALTERSRLQPELPLVNQRRVVIIQPALGLELLVK